MIQITIFYTCWIRNKFSMIWRSILQLFHEKRIVPREHSTSFDYSSWKKRKKLRREVYVKHVIIINLNIRQVGYKSNLRFFFYTLSLLLIWYVDDIRLIRTWWLNCQFLSLSYEYIDFRRLNMQKHTFLFLPYHMIRHFLFIWEILLVKIFLNLK